VNQPNQPPSRARPPKIIARVNVPQFDSQFPTAGGKIGDPIFRVLRLSSFLGLITSQRAPAQIFQRVPAPTLPRALRLHEPDLNIPPFEEGGFVPRVVTEATLDSLLPLRLVYPILYYLLLPLTSHVSHFSLFITWLIFAAKVALLPSFSEKHR